MSETQAEWIERVLGYNIGAASSRHTDAGIIGPVRFGKLRLAWLDARAAVRANLDQLRTAVLAEFADDPLAANLARLNEVIAGLAGGLEDSLDEATNATDAAKRRAALAAAQPVAERYLEYVLSDPLIDHIEANPFLPVIISGRLLGPLSEIVQALSEAKPQ